MSSWSENGEDIFVVFHENIRHYYEPHHVERYRGLQRQPRRDKVKELIAGLKKQQSVFTSRPDISAADVKASYVIGNDIAIASKTRKLYCGNSLLGRELLPFPKLLSLAFILYSVAASFPKMSLSKQKS